METPTKIAVAGLLIAVSVVSFGAFQRYRDAVALSDLLAQCEAENAQPRRTDSEGWESAPIVCDAEALVAIATGDERGVQRRIIEVQRQADSRVPNASLVAAIVAVLLSLPFLWYFMLRRLRELSRAVRGVE